MEHIGYKEFKSSDIFAPSPSKVCGKAVTLNYQLRDTYLVTWA